MQNWKTSILEVVILLIILTFTPENPVFAQKSLWGSLERGRYDVGLRVETFSDNTRSEKDSKGRSIEVFLWHPSKKSAKSNPLTLGDYYLLSEKKLKENELPEILSQDVTGDDKGIEAETARNILNSKMAARLNASPIKGTFPLVLWSARHLTVIAQSVLSEYLASHGYIVAFTRYQGEPLPFPFQIKEPEKKIEVLETHVQDLEFALSNLRQMKIIEAEKISVMSWSYGGESALKLQMRQSDVDFVLGLSSIRFDRGPYQGNFAVELGKLNVPYVLLWETIGTNGQPEPVPSIMREIPKESYYLAFKEMRHGNFNVLEGLIPGLFGIKKVQAWSKNDGFAQTGYEAVCRFSLFYLDHFLKGKTGNSDLIEKKLPKDFVQISSYGK